jgi:hypothetical protein
MVKTNPIYRPRGIYKPTGKTVWATSVWFEDRSIAKSVTGSSFKDVKVIKDDEFKMQRAGKNPKIERRI